RIREATGGTPSPFGGGIRQRLVTILWGAVLSSTSHKVAIGRIARPERDPNPKKTIKRLFEGEGKRSAYMDYLDAAPLARRVQDHARLRKLSSFRELMANVDACLS